MTDYFDVVTFFSQDRIKNIKMVTQYKLLFAKKISDRIFSKESHKSIFTFETKPAQKILHFSKQKKGEEEVKYGNCCIDTKQFVSLATRNVHETYCVVFCCDRKSTIIDIFVCVRVGFPANSID